MNKRIRQYIALGAAILFYYLIHEGAHLICALAMGVFKQVNFLGLGVQIDVFREQTTDGQLGWFCLLGALATLTAGYGLAAATKRICRAGSKVFRTVMYYVTLTMLLLDPLYLSILCGFFGGGDMNGISLLVPEGVARALFGLVFCVNIWLFRKWIYPAYKQSFA